MKQVKNWSNYFLYLFHCFNLLSYSGKKGGNSGSNRSKQKFFQINKTVTLWKNMIFHSKW